MLEAEAARERSLWFRVPLFAIGALILALTLAYDYAWLHSSYPLTPMRLLKFVAGPLIGLTFVLRGLLGPAEAEEPDSENRDLRQSDDRPKL